MWQFASQFFARGVRHVLRRRPVRRATSARGGSSRGFLPALELLEDRRLLSAGAALAPIRTLFNTGAGAAGRVLGDGKADPHYTITALPTQGNLLAPAAAFVVQQGNGFPFPPWLPDGSASKWIAPHANETFAGGGGEPAGNYTYETTFNLTELDPATAVITGQYADDDQLVGVRLNGSDLKISSPAPGDFYNFHPFTITGGFLPGVNTLDFVVKNVPGAPRNPSGLRVEMSGTAAVAATAPAAYGASYRLTHDQALSVGAGAGVLDHAFDAAGLRLTAALAARPSHGTLVLNPDGSFIYIPAPHFFGTDSFVYLADDGQLTSNPATVTLAVVEQAPTAEGHAYDLPHDQTLRVGAGAGVLTGAGDADGDPLTASLVSGPAHGNLSLNPDGSFRYVPAAGFVGTDSFIYRATDGLLSSAPATVLLSVLGTGPVARNNEVDVSANQSITCPALVHSASDADGDPLTTSVVSGPAHGSLTFHADGSFTYVPQPGYVGDDSFTWQASDGTTSSNTAVVLLHVLDFGQVVPDHEYAVHAGHILSVDSPGLLDGNGLGDLVGTDVGPLTAVLVGTPAHGTLTRFNADGSFVYVPAPGFAGIDTFTYQVADGALLSNVATVTVHVNDDPPPASDQTYDLTPGSTLTEPAPGVLQQANNSFGDPLHAVLINGPAHAASFTLNADGSFRYTPQPGFVGQAAFTFQVSDGVLSSAPAVVTLNVTSAPLAENDWYVRPASGPLTVSAADGVLANDFNPGSAPLTATLLQGPQDASGVVHGQLRLNADGSFTYTPDPAYAGSVAFTYQAGEAGNPGVTVGFVALEPAAAAPTAKLQQITFVGATTLKHDAGGAIAQGDPQWTPGAQYAVSYPVGSTLQVSGVLQLKVKNAADLKAMQNNLLVRGSVGGAGGAIALQPVQTVVGAQGRAGTVTITFTTTATAAFQAVAAYDQLTLTWEYSLNGGNTWTTAGTSTNQLYVTLGKPQGSDLFDTVVALGSRGLAGVQQPPGLLSAADAIFTKEFQSLTIKSVDDGHVQQYWSDTAAFRGQSTARLLFRDNGSCEAWAQLFIDVLRAQGLTVPASAQVEINPVYGAAMLVGPKQWSFAGKGAGGAKILPAQGDAKDTYVDQDLSRDNTTGDYKTGTPAEVTYNLNKTGKNIAQGVTNPPARFKNHFVVQLATAAATEIFDPSYGQAFKDVGGDKGIAGARQQVQNAEIAGFQLGSGRTTTIYKTPAGDFISGPAAVGDTDIEVFEINKTDPTVMQLRWTPQDYPA